MAKKKAQIRSPRTSKKKKTGPAKTTNIFEHVRLEGVRLLEVTSHLEIKHESHPVGGNVETRTTVGLTEKKENVLVDCYLTLKSQPKDEQADSTSLDISLRMQCVYKIVDDYGERILEHAQSFVDPSMHIVWPHLRELVQSITSRMGIPVIMLPLYVARLPFVPPGTKKASPGKKAGGKKKSKGSQ